MSPQRRHRVIEDDEEEDARPHQRSRNDSEGEVDQERSDDGMDGEYHHNQSIDQQLAKKLVRYAISCEFSRTAIKRDGIKERVLGDHGRAFKRVFSLAQQQLKKTWGMELRELPVREKTTLKEKRQAMRSQSQPKSGSGSYILTSTLPEAYRTATILAPSKTPSADDEATYAAFYTMVISMIWLNNGELTEQKLRRYLSRLNADQNVSMDKTETILKRMERQAYVVKKTEGPPLGQDGEHSVTWHLGPRAREEVGLDGVMGMVREVYGSWNPDLEKKLRSSLNIKERLDEEADGDEGEGETSRMATEDA